MLRPDVPVAEPDAAFSPPDSDFGAAGAFPGKPRDSRARAAACAAKTDFSAALSPSAGAGGTARRIARARASPGLSRGGVPSRTRSSAAALTALLQRAAVALLSGEGRGISGQLADALGLDDVEFKGGESLESGGVLLGKRFSKHFYLAYEKGLDATVGTLYFFLDINRALKLRAQTGQQSALDLIYTVSYD